MLKHITSSDALVPSSLFNSPNARPKSVPGSPEEISPPEVLCQTPLPSYHPRCRVSPAPRIALINSDVGLCSFAVWPNRAACDDCVQRRYVPATERLRRSPKYLDRSCRLGNARGILTWIVMSYRLESMTNIMPCKMKKLVKLVCSWKQDGPNGLPPPLERNWPSLVEFMNGCHCIG